MVDKEEGAKKTERKRGRGKEERRQIDKKIEWDRKRDREEERKVKGREIKT
jgi:hypothetical protein